MSEVAIAEVPIEPAPPTLAAPGAIAEPDAEPPEAAAAPEVETSVSVELDAVASAAVPAERALPFDVDHLGPLRRAVLDALVDADEPLSVARIIAEMPPVTTLGSAESAVKREFDQGRVIRTSPGHYTLAPARPVEQPKPTPPDPVCSDHTDEQWFAWLE